jgi:DNA-binding transcriptional MerR regulator
MNDRQTLRATAFSRPLPEKKYFKIGEVASLVGVEPHVLRYWETQFPQVRPHKARSGHRLYRRREVEVLLVIKELLHVQRFTIAGARQALRQQPGLAQSLIPQVAASDTLPPARRTRATFDAAFDATLDGAEDGDDGDADSLLDGEPLSDEAALESVEVSALEGDELQLAMEQQRHESRTAGLVQVDLEAEVAAVVPTRAASVALGAAGMGAALGAGHRAFAAHQKKLLEEALAEARGLLAFLDQADARAGARGASA